MATVYEITIGDIERRDSGVTIMKQFAGLLLIDGDERDSWNSTYLINASPVIGHGRGLWVQKSSLKNIELLDENGTLLDGKLAYESWPMHERDIGKIFLTRPLKDASPGAGERVAYDYLVARVS